MSTPQDHPVELGVYRAELHVHTVLSPCAQVEMIPPLIVREAVERGINLLAITDHNATANIAAVQQAARQAGLVVLPGMELQTQEEVHVLCLFDSLEQAQALQETVTDHLPDVPNRADYFGEQFVVDETGDFIRREERLLINSTSLSIKAAWEIVAGLGGLLIPAHVNRKAFGLLNNLGFVPTDFPVEVLEISRHLKPGEATQKFPQLSGYPLIQSGDVHGLDDFLGVMEFRLARPTITEIRQAIHQTGGRSYRILSQENAEVK
ncbi:MAG: PHP domain-containing protein [Anaerolineaceae bacterium]|nr:PHP domain-containing protein [Anaerolineaceae bacterium]